METEFCKIDLIPVAALVCYGVALMPFIPHDVRSVSAVALCFILTGIAGANALLAGRASGIARFTATLACSVGTGIVGGLILNFLPSGLVRFNWLTYALVVTLIAYAVARLRGAGSALQWRRPEIPIMTPMSGVKFVAAALAVIAAIALSVSSSHHLATAFTEIWFVPDGPAHSPVGATGAVFGIKSHEKSSEDFIAVIDTGEQVTTHRVTLAPDQMWTHDFSVKGQKPTANVYRGRVVDPPYRTVWFVRR